jgi:hypothetical protein
MAAEGGPPQKSLQVEVTGEWRLTLFGEGITAKNNPYNWELVPPRAT